MTLDERLVDGERAVRQIGVCGPGAFVVLKALAFAGRGEPKDVYDLYYVLANLTDSPSAVAARISDLRPNVDVDRAMEVLQRDFVEPDAIGSVSVARFLRHGLDDEIQADVCRPRPRTASTSLTLCGGYFCTEWNGARRIRFSDLVVAPPLIDDALPSIWNIRFVTPSSRARCVCATRASTMRHRERRA